MANQGGKACLLFSFIYLFLNSVTFPSTELVLGSKDEQLPCTSQQPVLQAGGKGSSYLDMCFGFVEQPKRGVPGAVWSQRDQNF